jgi:plastocyanin
MNIPGRQPLLLLFAGAVLSVGIAACGGASAADDEKPEAPAVTATSAPGDTNTDGDSVDSIVVSMKDNFFEPKEIVVPVGETVTIVARNDGMAPHNMVIVDTEFKSDVMVMGGEESSFELMFPKAGTYDFKCDYHVPDMVGTITVK